MSMTNKITADQFGDTIVEVMIVLAVLGLAIGISYATANRSLLNARQAQESSQAAGLAQTQVENLRLLAANTDPATSIFLPSTPSTFCVNNPLSATPIEANLANCTYPPVTYTILIYNCNKTPSVGPCATANGPDTFIVQATWPDVLGQGTDSVTLDYRLHSP